ncbi:MAG: hypothetical protein ABIG43_02120 [Chloroflexota bacterium]
MWLDEAAIQKRDLIIDPPYVNAAGSLGYYPEANAVSDWHLLGAFITNPVSLRARKPAENRVCINFAGGFLLHSGLPNPGFSLVLKRYTQRWAFAPLPVIVHLIAEDVKSLTQMEQRLEVCENVIAVELGFAPDTSADEAVRLIDSAVGELPIIVSLNPYQVSTIAPVLVDSRVSMVRICEARGMLPDDNGKLVHGRLYGPGLFPTALQAVHEVAAMGFTVIGGGAVYSSAQVNALFQAGVAAVSLDAVFWQGGMKLDMLVGESTKEH